MGYKVVQSGTYTCSSYISSNVNNMSKTIFAVFGGINKTEIYIYKTSVECLLIHKIQQGWGQNIKITILYMIVLTKNLTSKIKQVQVKRSICVFSLQ